jgi:hypothetical protein
MTRTFVRLPEFEKQCKHIGLDEDDIMEIENTLLENSAAGDIIRGTGGMRKLRITLFNKGKSGGARVIYVDFAFYEKVYFITTYAKNELDNLSQAERNELKVLMKILEGEARGRVK